MLISFSQLKMKRKSKKQILGPRLMMYLDLIKKDKVTKRQGFMFQNKIKKVFWLKFREKKKVNHHLGNIIF